jgi:hypothetical protein
LVVSTCIPAEIFNVHKAVLEDGCPYFRTLFRRRLSIQELAENQVILDSAVDSVDAWGLVIEYLYLGDYGITGRRLGGAASDNRPGMGEELYINARVYVLALKLCMEELKLLAVRRVEALLAGFYSFSTLTVIGLRKMVEIVYPNTPDADGQSADEGEYKIQNKNWPSSATDFWQTHLYRLISIRCASLWQSTPRRVSSN